MNDIDVVITWVDGSDPAWLAEKNQYKKLAGIPAAQTEEELAYEAMRYRDWDNLRYLFRGIDTFMPWVRKVHFVTWGHLPEWLNTSYEKLHIVKHSDFIPEEFLPTFSVNPIEMNMHRIPGLAENFVYFNDDTFVIRPTQPKDFFTDGKPKDMAALSPQPIYRDPIINIQLNDLQLLSDYYSIEDVRKNPDWHRMRLYGSYAIRTKIFERFSTITGIFVTHIPYSFCKSTFEKLWETEGEALTEVTGHRFRCKDDLNIWLMRYDQLLSGNFAPRDHRFGKMISAGNSEEMTGLFADKKCHLVCLNDDRGVTDFERSKKFVKDLLQERLPNPCPYEKG